MTRSFATSHFDPEAPQRLCVPTSSGPKPDSRRVSDTGSLADQPHDEKPGQEHRKSHTDENPQEQILQLQRVAQVFGPTRPS